MTRTTKRSPLAVWASMAAMLLSILGIHCSSGGSDPAPPVASFESSGTPREADLVRLAEESRSGDMVTLRAELTGPTASSDIYGFSFSILIEDVGVAELLAGSAQAGSLLDGDGCDGVNAQAAQNGNRIIVGVTKLGTCAGNGIADAETQALILFTLRAITAGTTSVRIETANPARPALAADSAGDPIPEVVFDGEPAHIIGL